MKKQVWINLGCGVRLLSGFVNVDVAFDYDDIAKKEGVFKNAVIEDGAEFVRSDIRKLPFPDNYADYILSHYSIEHLPMRDVVPALREWKRVLKPKGEIYIATLDFDCVVELWTKLVAASNKEWNVDEFIDVAQMIYGNQITAGEFHYCPFNAKVINVMMTLAEIPYWETLVVPAWSTAPEIKGYPKRDGILTCTELHVRAYKTIPKQKGKRQ